MTHTQLRVSAWAGQPLGASSGSSSAWGLRYHQWSRMPDPAEDRTGEFGGGRRSVLGPANLLAGGDGVRFFGAPGDWSSISLRDRTEFHWSLAKNPFVLQKASCSGPSVSLNTELQTLIFCLENPVNCKCSRGQDGQQTAVSLESTKGSSTLPCKGQRFGLLA